MGIFSVQRNFKMFSGYIQQEPIKSKYEIGDVDELLDRHWFSVMKGWRKVCFNEIRKKSNK